MNKHRGAHIVTIPANLPHQRHTWLLVLLAGLLLAAACDKNRGAALKIGDPAPSFAAADLNGNPFALDVLQGRPVVIRFFLTDCPYCKADTPAFRQYYLQNRDKGLAMVYLNSRDATPEASVSFAREQELPFPVIFDKGGEIARRYQVKMMPQTIILDPQHKIVGALLGGVGEAELEELAGPYL